MRVPRHHHSATRAPSHRQRGSAILELVLVLIPLALLLVGAAELGRALYTYNVLGQSARDAVRYLSQQPPGNAATRQVARCLSVYGTEDCAGTPLVTGLTTSQIVICDALACPATHASQQQGSAVMNLVTVSITGYAFQSVLTWAVPDMTFRTLSATMRGTP
jgi:Flp pilus assembly protein TadG